MLLMLLDPNDFSVQYASFPYAHTNTGGTTQFYNAEQSWPPRYPGRPIRLVTQWHTSRPILFISFGCSSLSCDINNCINIGPPIFIN